MHKCKFDAQKIQKRRLKTQPVDSYLVMWVPLLLVGLFIMWHMSMEPQVQVFGF